jgi:hypothetical protein
MVVNLEILHADVDGINRFPCVGRKYDKVDGDALQ